MTTACEESPPTAGPWPGASLRRFLDEVLTDDAASRYDAQQEIDAEDLRSADAAGLWQVLLPLEYRGTGGGLEGLGDLAEALGGRCTSWRNLLTVQSMVQWAVLRWGSDQQRADWLPALASGRERGCFCLTEPGGGGAGARVEAVAERIGGGWAVTGRKKWITGAVIGTVFMVMARYQGSIVALLVPRETKGLHVTPVRDMLGARASFLGEVVLEDVRLPESALLGPDAMGSGAVMISALDIGRYTVARGACGLHDRCLEEISRAVWSSPVRDRSGDIPEQLVVAAGKLSTELEASRLLCERAERLHRSGDPAAMLAMWQAKYHASDRAATAARTAVQVRGAEGCVDTTVAARFYRDAKTVEIIEGTAEMHHRVIGRDVLARKRHDV